MTSNITILAKKGQLPCQSIDPGKGAFDVAEPQVTHGKGKGRVHSGYSWRRSGEGIHNTGRDKHGNESLPRIPKKQVKRLDLRQKAYDERAVKDPTYKNGTRRPGSLNKHKSLSVK